MNNATTTRTEKAIWLQGIGYTDAIPAEQLTVGSVTVWNSGAREVVEAIERVSPKFLAVTFACASGRSLTRRIKADRLVGVAL